MLCSLSLHEIPSDHDDDSVSLQSSEALSGQLPAEDVPQRPPRSRNTDSGSVSGTSHPVTPLTTSGGRGRRRATRLPPCASARKCKRSVSVSSVSSHPSAPLIRTWSPHRATPAAAETTGTREDPMADMEAVGDIGGWSGRLDGAHSTICRVNVRESSL